MLCLSSDSNIKKSQLICIVIFFPNHQLYLIFPNLNTEVINIDKGITNQLKIQGIENVGILWK